jgi:hypothetical protein
MPHLGMDTLHLHLDIAIRTAPQHLYRRLAKALPHDRDAASSELAQLLVVVVRREIGERS